MPFLITQVERLFHAEFGRAGKVVLLCLCVVLIGLAGTFRIVTEAQHALSLVLLLPTIAVSWFIGLAFGLSVAVLAVLSWLSADLFVSVETQPAWVLYSNALVRGGVFCLVAYITSALREAYRRQRALASQDPLTGLANRRQFMSRLELERQRSARSRRPITIAYLDLDDFKAVNDSLGHDKGDQVLRIVGGFLTRNLRDTDCAARLGGDEFAVMLPETGLESALIVIDKARHRIQALLTAHGLTVGLSVGVASFVSLPGSVREMLEVADRLMYEVKQDGKRAIRHRVVDVPQDHLVAERSRPRDE
ncbi:MAG: diguanylate cyclase [Sterolibacteriaceae bacterium]|uniref:diguanylate cyclase n=1 Tax=Candidatus Methylophosphatis roskildensis TaxID=2899263 RepID=A0A9D7E2H5_9PROT|nr:diguanylate cyclase [Candidatus Methylophosphatis roskildensis]